MNFTLTTLILIVTVQAETSQNNKGFLIKTSACSIPDFDMLYNEVPSMLNCRERFIVVERLHGLDVEENLAKIRMKSLYNTTNQQCCYRYIYDVEGEENEQICFQFVNNTIVRIKSNIINIMCLVNGTVTYQDVFVFTKDYIEKGRNYGDKPFFSVILLGLQSVSRKRAHKTIPKTMAYLHNKDDWLDFRGYNKIHHDTKTNLNAILAGKTRVKSTENMLWEKYSNKGYVTAYLEDNIMLEKLELYSKMPTFYNPRRLFINREIKVNTTVCTGRVSSAQQVLSFALDFARTYNERKYFGVFWLKSFSEPGQSPWYLDDYLIEFFEKIRLTSMYDRTFFMLFSDGGANIKDPPQFSYHESQLPMLFMWVPKMFRKMYPKSLVNLVINQYRLVTPFDLYMTLLVNLKLNQKWPPKRLRRNKCQSLFKRVNDNRTCGDVGISKLYCGCFPSGMVEIPTTKTEAKEPITIALKYVQGRVSASHNMTYTCAYCLSLSFDKILRLHKYNELFDTYYIVAFRMRPENVAFQVIIRKVFDNPEVVALDVISEHKKDNGHCVRDFSKKRDVCICRQDRDCLYSVMKLKKFVERMKRINITTRRMLEYDSANKIREVPAVLLNF